MTLEEFFIARLQAIDPQPFALVAGATDFASIDKAPMSVPAAYVLVEEEVSAENTRATGPVLQRCEADIAVVIVTRNLADRTGEAAAADLGELKRAVRKALLGAIPDDATGEPVEHVEGKLLRARDGYAWQRELFSAAGYLEEE